MMKQFFSAKRHQGAFLNGHPIKTSNVTGTFISKDSFCWKH